MGKSIEELLECPYWIIDILPKQVPADGAGQYFAVEKYYLGESQLASIKQKHINVVLKLNCYMDVYMDEGEVANPSPHAIAEAMNKRYVIIRFGESMMVSEPDDTHMTLFNPDEQLLELVEAISTSEGLFVWKPQQ
ncbi:MAG: hypothetical protein IJI68_08345 [Eggerthellaceae bacterium]|nr:hypothetical protein [Eggerthellaceae bacterium]